MHYEHTIHGGINAAFDIAGITDGAYGVARQTSPAYGHAGPAWADVGSAGLYPIVSPNRVPTYLR